jgi:DNA-binding NtrC family response regulator
MPSTTTLDEPAALRAPGEPSEADLALAIVWASHEPARVGEILAFPRASRRLHGDFAPKTRHDGDFAPKPRATAFVFGRGDGEDRGDEPFVHPVRQRPGVVVEVTKVVSAYLSRRALRLRPQGDSIRVESVGRRPVVRAGVELAELVVREGDVFELKGLFAFLCVRREGGIPPSLHLTGERAAPPFGEADAHGIVGESPAAWALRDRLAFVGPRSAHVLVVGESGTGKELVARAVHESSGRRAKRLVSRNAATIPSGLADAELFGNVASYPNVGMPERAGLIGEADGSTLFLDEIAELPFELQSHLLRVLDEGEYQRLGDARRRRSDFRLLAATNRSLDRLKPELLARIGLRVEVPRLGDRREDVPLVARHVARQIAAGDPELGARFLAAWNGATGQPRFAVDLVVTLVQHAYTTNVRELASLLWASFASSRGDTLELTPEVRRRVGGETEVDSPSAERTPEEVRAVLAKHGGVQARAYRELGLPSRHALRRLMKKLGVAGADGAEGA